LFRFIRLYFIIIFVLYSIFFNINSDLAADIKNFDKKIPDIFIMTLVKNTFYFILVEKNSQQLYLYSYDGSSYKQILNTICSTGKINGAKTMQGDKKTPEGIYFFENKYEAKQLSAIYGNGAFSLNFPNSLDRLKGINGTSIWLHGTNKDIKPTDSNGCVVVTNKIFDKLTKYINLKKTPIIVIDKLNYIKKNSYKKETEAILSLIYKTNGALENGTYHDYLSYYSSNFLPNITWWNNWINYKKNLNKYKIFSSIKQYNILILKYKTFYLAVFDQYIKLKNSNEKKYIGREKKFIEFINKKPRIISEETLEMPKNLSQSTRYPPFLMAYSELIKKADQETKITKIKEKVNFWLKAWALKDINSYAECYSEKFRFGKMNLNEWLRYKKNLNNKYKFIKVTAKNLTINLKNNQCVVSFVQNYISDAYRAKGIKTITLVLEHKEWKIYQELWKKI